MPIKNWLQKSTNPRTQDLPCCCICNLFDSYYLVQEAEKSEERLGLEVLQMMKNNWFLVGSHNLE